MPGPVSIGWSPLASAGTVTAAVLRWITLWSCRHDAIGPLRKFRIGRWSHQETGPVDRSSQVLNLELKGDGSRTRRSGDVTGHQKSWTGGPVQLHP